MDIHAYSQLWMTPWGSTKTYPKDYTEMVGFTSVIARMDTPNMVRHFVTHKQLYERISDTLFRQRKWYFIYTNLSVSPYFGVSILAITVLHLAPWGRSMPSYTGTWKGRRLGLTRSRDSLCLTKSNGASGTRCFAMKLRIFILLWARYQIPIHETIFLKQKG